MIRFEGVSKVFEDGTKAIDELNLEIEAGSFTVLVGPSGCGKTTALRMINKMATPTSGRVIVAGNDVAQVDAVQLRRKIGFVLQHAGLLPHKSVLDNIAETLRLNGVSKRAAREGALEAMRLVRLPDELYKRYPAKLSGGQQQRVGVARALAADAPILLMDEPFSALDPALRADLQDEMLELKKKLHKTIVFVTHDIDEALRLGDKIVVMAPGGIVQQYAEPEEILRRPANDFVAELIGRDRGFRALGFWRDELPVKSLPERDASGCYVFAGGARLIVDDARRPVAWQTVGVETASQTKPVTVVPGASLRVALDAALAAPGNVAPVVDAEGVLVGVCSLQDVARVIEAKNHGLAAK